MNSLESDDSAEPTDPLVERSRALFQDSVDGLDFALRSRLTQARNAALAAAATSRPAWFARKGFLTPAGVTAAAILGAFLWLGSPLGPHAVTVANDGQSLEDLEIVAATDEGAGDTLDMLQDDIDFYDWADKTANPGPSA